jgi:hypothetical protein
LQQLQLSEMLSPPLVKSAMNILSTQGAVAFFLAW